MDTDQDALAYMEQLHCQELHFVSDNETGLKAVVAIHNTQLGPALGGCRWLPYKNTQSAVVDAVRLAQAMTHKASISGLNLGGGKAVLLKPDKIEDEKAYFESFGSFLNKLNGRYITAVDSGSATEHMDIIKTVTPHVTSTSDCIYSFPDPSPLTAFGIARGIEAAVKFKLKRDDIEGVHVAVVGVGHVGYNLVHELHKRFAQVTICDVNKTAIQKCVDECQVNVVEDLNDLLTRDFDVFAPCALGAILNADSIRQLKCKIVVGAANNQLKDPIKDANALHAKNILYAPDFAVNAGGLIYVAGQHERVSEETTWNRVSNIYHTMLKIFERSHQENRNTWDVAHDIALERVKDAG